MGIKWSSFEESKRKKFMSLDDWLLISPVIGVLGIGVMIHLFSAYWYPTAAVWSMGLLSNVCFAVALITWLLWWLKRKYKDWQPVSEAYYEEWKHNWDAQQRVMGIVLAAALLIVLFLIWLRANLNGIYPKNHAFIYLLFATVGMQWFLAEVVLIRQMNVRLQKYMEMLQVLHKKQTEAALQYAAEVEKESREKVSRSDRLRMDLITNVSHDLKTPLTSMVGYLELLKKEEMNDTAKDYLQVISRRADKLSEMIESLFSLAKVSSGNVEFQKEEISMNCLVEQICADMDDKIKASELQFVMNLTEEGTDFEADNSYMYRVCQNLMENALKYAQKGPRVFVKTDIQTVASDDESQKKVVLELTNTAGYPMDFSKEDIVERFARGDRSRTTEGNGLGLAIVSTYVNAMGGTFDIFIDCDQFKTQVSFPLHS